MRVVSINPDSPLYGHVRAGHELVTVNGREVRDSLDFQFLASDEMVELTFEDRGGKEQSFRVDNLYPGALGLTFEDENVRRCRCNCVFCFVRQQPRRMRRSLYVRDEDYRLSFTHGNYITLSNVNQADLDRIVEQRLSPLYVSVHTTDDELRRQMLGNRRLQPILPQLNWLVERGIRLHTQAVICPGINDGKALQDTIDDLAALQPGLATLAVVPVGLTRYREHLPRLRRPDAREAEQSIDMVERFQQKNLTLHGTRFVWPSDEYYLLAGRRIPPLSHYEDMEQWENGVGMIRQATVDFNRRRRFLRGSSRATRVVLLTGMAASEWLKRTVVQFAREIGLNVKLIPVVNRFWGEMVTVSGLLTGADMLAAAIPARREFDLAVLPPNCLNSEGLCLDDMSLDEFRKRLGRPVMVGQYSLYDTLKEALQ